MAEWRADGAAPSPTQGRPLADLRPNRRREEPYVPPPATAVRVMHLGELLPPSRPIPETQQERLGFASESPLGPSVWCVGDIALLSRPCVAIVGTRQVSPEGAARARRLARELSEAGVVVVSGLARGVDTEALTEALKARGHVVAVIGTPVDKAYPAENKRLQEQIYREHLLVSQFPPHSRSFPSNFPARNKLMATLTDATAVIEASDSSGALHQTAECVKLGRWLFIAQQGVLDNKNVHWPADFMHYKTTRALKTTADILQVLGR
jgi:DNA processing protein